MRQFKSGRLSIILALASLHTAGAAEDLAGLVSRALSHRLSVESARLAVLSAKQSAIAAGAYLPTRLEAGTGTRPDVSGGEDLTLFHPIDLFGKARAARIVGDAGVKLAEAGLLQSSLEVQGEVLQSLAQVRFALTSQANAGELLKIAVAVEAATKARVDAQALPDIQLVRAQLETSRAQQVLADKASDTDAATRHLRQAMHDSIDLGSIRRLDFTASNTSEVFPRTEQLSVQAQMQQAQAEGRQANLMTLPDFEIQARRSPWADPGQRYAVRLQLVWPLWDNGQARAKRVAANLQVQAFAASLSDLSHRHAAEREITDAEWTAAQASVASFKKIVETSRNLVKRTELGFAAGAITQTDIYEARRSLQENLESLALAQQRLELAVEASLRARGRLLGTLK